MTRNDDETAKPLAARGPSAIESHLGAAEPGAPLAALDCGAPICSKLGHRGVNMKLTSAILVVASVMGSSDAHAGSASATMGVGLRIVAVCRVSNCASAPGSALRPRVPPSFRGANSPVYVTTRPATATAPETLTMTY